MVDIGGLCPCDQATCLALHSLHDIAAVSRPPPHPSAGLVLAGTAAECERDAVPGIDDHNGPNELGELLLVEVLAGDLVGCGWHVGVGDARDRVSEKQCGSLALAEERASCQTATAWSRCSVSLRALASRACRSTQ